MNATQIAVAVALVAGLVLVVWLARGKAAKKKAGAGRVARLRREWIRQSHLPQRQADEALERTVAALQERYPGRSLAWYLEKAVQDLERARR